MIIRKYIFLFCLFCCVGVSAQENVLYEEDVPLIYRKEANLGINIHTNGWGAGFRKGKHLTGYKKRMMDFELVSMHHPKEIKMSYNDNGKEYIFGKLNSLLIARGGIGLQKVLYGKGDRSGIEIRYVCSGGISAGLTKPVYLYVGTKTGMMGEGDIVIEKYNPEKHNQNNIFGKAEFGYGMNEIKIHPGVFGKAGLSFEYGTKDTDVKAVETGITLDFFPQAIPLMALTKNRKAYFSLYIMVTLFGRKW